MNETISGVSYGALEMSPTADPRSSSDIFETPERRRNSSVLSDATVLSAASGTTVRFVLRRANVRRQQIVDVVKSLRRPHKSPHVPPSDTAPESALVDVESIGRGGAAADAPPTLHPEPKIGTVGLLSAVTSLVLGSRFGSESMVEAAGPYWSLLGVAVVPWLWYLPTGLVVAELSTAVPSNAGVLMWTNVAYPAPVAFFCVFASLLLNVAGLATAAALVASYMAEAFAMPAAVELLMRAVAIALGGVINAWTIDGLNASLQVITVATTLPFIVMTIVQACRGGFSAGAMEQQPSNINVALFLSFLSFSHSGLENLGSLVEDTKNPGKTIFRAITPAMLASFFIYFLPITAGVSAMYHGVGQDSFSQWKPGYWVVVASHIGGPTMKYWMSYGAVLARFAALLSTTACSARMLAGMGSMNAFPLVASNFVAMYHDTRLTPVNAIIVASTLALPVAVLLSTDDLVAVFQCLSGVRLLVAVYASFFILRWKYPALPRPYTIPVPTWGCALLLAPSILFVSSVVVASFMLSRAALAVSLACLMLCVILSCVWTKFLKPEGLCGAIEHFPVNDVPPSSFIEYDETEPEDVPMSLERRYAVKSFGMR